MTETNNLTDTLSMIIEGLQERKARRITIVDMSELETAAAHRFVICEGTSTMHVTSIADSVREYLLENGRIKPYSYDGYANSQWIVIDYGDTIVHVFLPEERSRYNLEELWSDAVIEEIPDQY
ncbi:MAG: ribosome silencing factor [Duncaniella sp.]|nr:ribosome silencing factor [Duncaniella sp.]